jgi:HK97 family phage major capsid protein
MANSGELELTTEDVRRLVADAVREAVRAADVPKAEDRPAPPSAPAVLRRKPERISIARMIRAMRDKAWDRFPLERDYVQAARELANLRDADPSNAVLPTNLELHSQILEQADLPAPERPALRAWIESVRAMGEGTTAAGGALVPPQYLQEAFIHALMGPIAFRQAPGVDVIPVNSNLVYFPREVTAPASGVSAEAGTLTSADATFAQQSITIQKQYAYAQFSNELLADANPAFDRYIARTLVRSLTRKQDQQYLEGTGVAPQITGLGAYSGLTSGYTPAANGDSWSAQGALDEVIDLVYILRTAGVEPNAWIMHPRTMQSLAKVKDSQGRYVLESVNQVFGAPVLIPAAGSLETQIAPTPPTPYRATLLGLPVLLSDQISITETQGSASNATHVYLGDFNFARVLERQAIELATSEHIAFTTDQTAVRAIGRSAIVLLAPAAFIKQGGIIP